MWRETSHRTGSFFEPLSILETCREAVEDNLTLLEEAGFSVEYTENDYQVISDKKGLMFILGQIISNSVKYAGNNPAPQNNQSVRCARWSVYLRMGFRPLYISPKWPRVIVFHIKLIMLTERLLIT